MNIDDIEDIFKEIDKLMQEEFTGGAKLNNRNYEEEDDDDIVDVYEDNKHVYITIELRGMQEEDVNVDIKPKELVIEILYNGRVLEQIIKLPCKVKTKGKISFNNYVLDIVLTKDKRKVKNGKVKKW